jgi:hypothetical protein
MERRTETKITTMALTKLYLCSEIDRERSSSKYNYHSQFIWIHPAVGIASSLLNSSTKCDLNFVVGKLVSINFTLLAYKN